MAILASKSKKKVLLVVPTEKLRDEGWPDEFKKWEADYSKVKRVCYASLNKVKGDFDMVVLDEAHHITPNNFEFFENNKVEDIMALTATPPQDEVKQELLKKIGCSTIFEYPLDRGVKDGVVAPYEIKVVQCVLNNSDRYIEAGRKGSKFKTTEYKQYEYLSRQISKLHYAGREVPKFMYLNRMRFLYNLKSKTEVAKKIIEKIPEDERTLVFCGSINQAVELCKHRFFSQPAKSHPAYKQYKGDRDLVKFKKEKINMLSAVGALNEGHNIPNLDNAIIVQLNSNELDLVQRIGRVVRYREGHLAKIWVLTVVNTQDEKWAEKALSNLQNIEYMHYKTL